MRLVAVFAAMLCFTSMATAAAPKDVFGYFPGQSKAAALAVDTTRPLDICKGGKPVGCLHFTADYLKNSADFSVVFDGDAVKHVGFTIMNFDKDLSNMKVTNCAQLAAVVVDAAHGLYGDFAESDDPKLKLLYYTWSGEGLVYKLTVMCFPARNGILVGGVVGSFERDAAH